MSGWTRRALGSVATIERLGLLPDQIPDGTKYLGLENISRGGTINSFHTIGEVTVASTKFSFTDRHILYGKLRPNLGKIARPAFAGVCSTDILPVLPGPEVDRNYLANFLAQPDMVEFAASRAAGANLPRLSPTELARFEVPLPPIDEQRRIAAILDQADALRAKRREALALLDDLTQSIFIDMFGSGPTIWSRWDSCKMADLLEFLTSGSRGWAKYYADRGDLFLRIQNVRRDELDLTDVVRVRAPESAEAKRTRVRPGDVLLSITADLGRTAVVPESIGPAYINQHLSILRAPSMAPRFLSAFLSSPEGQRQFGRLNRQAVKAGLNFDDIRSVAIPVAPRDLQDRFVRLVNTVEQERKRYLLAREQADVLFSALQTHAFSGRL